MIKIMKKIKNLQVKLKFTDFSQTTLKNLDYYQISTLDDIRHAPIRMAAFGAEVAEKNKELKQ